MSRRVLLLLGSSSVVSGGGCPHSASRRLGEWRALKLHKEDLDDDARFAEVRHEFEGTLTESGILAVDLPGFAQLRRSTLAAFQACVAQSDDVEAVSMDDDATVRRSLASSTKQQPMVLSTGCPEFEALEAVFRGKVLDASRTFAKRLDGLLGTTTTFLEQEGGEGYETLSDVVERGDHLEHFHSYTSTASSGGPETLGLHTDAGLFIGFTPALSATPAKFTLELRDGSRVEVGGLEEGDYDSSVVFMLGEAILDHSTSLRAPPHSLKVAEGDRAWYGLMVLPPSDALPPWGARTYGELKAAKADGGGLGCQGGGGGGREAGRQLQSTQGCADNELYCWWRCMEKIDFDGFAVSDEICADAGFQFFNCTDASGQPNDGEVHGDFAPACTDYTHYTMAPTVAPADESLCEGVFQEAMDASSSFGERDLTYTGRAWEDLSVKTGYLQWDVVGSVVHLKHSYFNRMGWMAIGLSSSSEGRDMMLGSAVVMAIDKRGVSSEEAATFREIEEYRISEEDTSFRHWAAPVVNGSDLRDTELFIADDNCYATSSFALSELGGESLTLDKCHHMIWAISSDTVYASDPIFKKGGYHEYRGDIWLNFSHPTGHCTAAQTEGSEEDDDHYNDQHDHDHADFDHSSSSSSSSSKKSEAVLIGCLVAAALLATGVAVAAYYKVYFASSTPSKQLAEEARPLGSKLQVDEESKI